MKNPRTSGRGNQEQPSPRVLKLMLAEPLVLSEAGGCMMTHVSEGKREKAQWWF